MGSVLKNSMRNILFLGLFAAGGCRTYIVHERERVKDETGWNEYDVEFHATDRPKAEGIILLPITYTLTELAHGYPIPFDIFQLLRGKPRNTFFHSCLYLNGKDAVDKLSDTSTGVTSKKEISRKFLGKVEPNELEKAELEKNRSVDIHLLEEILKK